MVAHFTNTPPRNVRETINWLIRLGRPPLPECPIEAAKQGKDPKQPCFLDGKYLKTVNWKQWQNSQPIDEIYNAWFTNPKTGIGTLGGWNGKHWLGWIDFDQKDFASSQECDRSIAAWLEQYPLTKDAPMCRTPSGGYRFLVAFNQEPENFKANSGFSLNPDGSDHVGELLSKNGGHTLLPPTVGVSGKAYEWVQWSEYPPIVDQPEDIGLYPLQKKTSAKSSHPNTTRGNSWTGGTTLTDLLQYEIYPRLTLERAFNWHGHDFRQHGSKLKGNCPWHDSKSGTAFYAEIKDGSPVWRCPACDIGGSVIEYRHRLSGGNGSPRGSEFVALVKELAGEVNVPFPDRSFNPGNGGSGGGRRGSGGSSGGGGDDGDGGSSGGNVVKFPGFEPLTTEQITQKIDELIIRGVTGSQKTAELNRLAASTQTYIGELRRLYDERLTENDIEGDRDTTRDEVGNLLKLTDQSLDLADYLPPSLAEPLSQWCGWQALRPAVVLTALLTGASTLHKVGTELVIHRNKHFKVPPTIYSALVAESGQLKSPVFSNIVQKPADLTLFYFTNATGESIPIQASKAPDKGLLALIDELAGLFKSENAHRSGRGSDKQDLLSYFDGLGQTVLRASGVKVDVERIYLSIFGTIQPEILKNHMMDCTDPDGQWARFLFVNQPLSFAPLGDDDGQAVSISDRIADFYRRLHRLPELEYRLSRSAFKRYQPFHDQLERLRVTHPKAGMRAVYSKMKGYVGRLALNLHALWELDADKNCPNEEIPAFIMEMAIALTKFYIGQIKLVHSDSDSESLPRHITKLIELSRRLEANGQSGWIKAQQYRDQFQGKKRPSAQQARDWMNEAVTLGYGRTRGTGNRLEYHWMCDNNVDDNQPTSPDNLGNLGKLREDLGNTYPEVETIENKGVENNLGNLGKGIPNLPRKEAESLKTGEEWSEPSLEGGYVPEVSRAYPQESCDVEPVGGTDLGNNLGKPFPNFPEVPEVCDSSAQVVTVIEDAIATTAPTKPECPSTKVEPIQVGDRVALVTDPTKIGTVQEIDPEFRRPYNVVFDNPITAENYVFYEDWVAADQLRGLVDS
jgi:hypothetical protein